MKNGKHTMRISRRAWLMGLLLCPLLLPAQDVLPASSRPMAPLRMPGETGDARRAGMPVAERDSLPATFVHARANIIEDPSRSLAPFFAKLDRMDRPVRIVHIGDSHVRGHLFPLVARRRLEEDFGSAAVFPDEISYRTGGLAQETGEPGPVYHILGVNGATAESFSTAERIAAVAALHPDLVIVSFGTNEAHGRRYQAAAHRVQLAQLLSMLQAACPGAAFLLTTPPGAYAGGRRARTANPRTATVAGVISGYARQHGMAVWDLYEIAGGKSDACRNWTKHRLLRPDGIHFTAEGYRLQGNLLHQALIKAYNGYVASGLE